jgi:DNA-binding CsgD family transcriptional regulator
MKNLYYFVVLSLLAVAGYRCIWWGDLVACRLVGVMVFGVILCILAGYLTQMGKDEVQHDQYGHLSKRDKEIVELYLEGLEVEEIAERLNLKTKTVYNILTQLHKYAELPKRRSD